MPYVPLDSSFLRSTVLEHGPVVVACWTLVLASADKLGETDINPTTLAGLLRISKAEAKDAWEVLTSPDPDSHNREFEGRRLISIGDGKWKLTSYDKYQAKASRATATARQARYAERVKNRERLSRGQQDTASAFADMENEEA
jgi:hypothetical protein